MTVNCVKLLHLFAELMALMMAKFQILRSKVLPKLVESTLLRVDILYMTM